MRSNFIKEGYHPSLINEQLEGISLLNRIELIKKKGLRKKSVPKPLGKIEITYR